LVNAIISNLNAAGDFFCENALQIFIQSSFLIATLYFVDVLIRRHVKAVVRYCIWLLVLVKLVLPPSLSLPSGIGYWLDWEMPTIAKNLEKQVEPTGEGLVQIDHEFSLPTDINDKDVFSSNIPGIKREIAESRMTNILPVILEKNVPDQTAVDRTISKIESDNSQPPVVVQSAVAVIKSEQTTQITWRGGVFLMWIACVCLIATPVFRRIIFIRNLVAESEPARGELSMILTSCRQKVGVKREVDLRITKDLLHPAICGLCRPRILLPVCVLSKLTRQKMEMVLIHELLHIKRRDLWVNMMQTLLQICYFYHPLVWLANSYIRKTREQAVDEMVLITLDGAVKNYSYTLLDLAELAFSRPNYRLGLVGVVESKNRLKERIRIMLTRPIPRSAKVSITGIFAVLLMAAVLLPMARGQNKANNGDVKLPPPKYEHDMAHIFTEQALVATVQQAQQHVHATTPHIPDVTQQAMAAAQKTQQAEAQQQIQQHVHIATPEAIAAVQQAEQDLEIATRQGDIAAVKQAEQDLEIATRQAMAMIQQAQQHEQMEQHLDVIR